MEKCPICRDGALGQKALPLRAEVSGHVFTAQVAGQRCERCGVAFVDGPDIERFELAVASALADAGEASPGAFKYIRKAMGLKAAELASWLGVTPESISRWENGKHPIEAMAVTRLALLAKEAAVGPTALLDSLRARAGRGGR